MDIGETLIRQGVITIHKVEWTMGLDDFTGDTTLSEDYQELRKELSQNSPPEDKSKWHRYEPGTPDWLSFISGKEQDSDSVPSTLDYNSRELNDDTALVVKIEDVKTTTLASSEFVNLENCV